MLKQVFNHEVALGLIQVGFTAVLALAVMLAARRRRIHLERETVVALARGLVQIVIVGWVLIVLLRGPRWTSVFILAAMLIAAARISARRAAGIPGAFRVSLYAIGCGAGVVVFLMTLVGVIHTAITTLIPIGSMVIANAMNTNSLVLNRFRAEVESHTGLIETALALGASSKATAQPYTQAACESSLIPAIDSMRSLGIVWIPGLMTGMLLAGANPIYAALYQFVIIAMIFSASGLTSMVGSLLVRSRAFSSAEQLTLRPGIPLVPTR
ncbi:MAG: ABC transporter permease [Terriglobia bacterium]